MSDSAIPPKSPAGSRMPRGRCTLLVVDVAGYGGVRTITGQKKVRDRYYRMLLDCLVEAGVEPAECYEEDRGDGFIMTIPERYERLPLVSSFLGELQYRLREHNGAADKKDRLRLRVGLHVGEVDNDGRGLVGTDVNFVFRLIESRGLKREFGESTASLAFIASDEFYESVIKPAPRPVDPDEFKPLLVKEKEARAVAWVQFRGEVDPRDPDDQDEVPGELCPYPGLAPFGTDHVRWFFGRERVMKDLLELLSARAAGAGPLVVVGPSGVGKSSLLRAGLVDALKNGRLAVPGSGEWPRLLFTPTASPVRELAARLGAEPGGEPADEWCDALVERAARLADGAGRLVIVVDQFEEIFTLCSDESQRRLFVRVLCALSAGGTALVVLGLRADFFAPCMDYPGLVDAIRSDFLPIEPMTPAELREVITRPAEDVGLEIADGLVEILLSDLDIAEGDRATGALPLLAHALRATWQQCRGRALTIKGYQITGRVQGAIAETAERVYRRLDPAEEQTARRLLLHLVKITGDGPTRCRADRDSLHAQPEDPAAAKVLEALAAARLVTLDDTTVEIAHDALLDRWPRLRGWIDADRTGLLIRQQLTEKSEAWIAGGGHPSDLYRGPRLEAAREWAESGDHEADLPEHARTFLTASIEASQAERLAVRRRTRRLRRLVVGFATAFAVAVVTTVFAVDSRQTMARERTLAQSRQIAGESAAGLQSRPWASLLQSVQAYRVRDSVEARNGLLSTQAHYQTGRIATNGPAYAVAFSPDGRTVAGADHGGVRLWDGTSHRPAGTVVGGAPAYSVAYSPDGRLLAAADQTGGVMLWHTGRRAADPLVRGTDRSGPVNSVAFGPGGRTLATAGHDGVVRLWDVRTRRVVEEFQGDRGPVESIAFGGPGGRTLAGVGTDTAVTLWDVSSGKRLGRPAETATPSRVVAFSPDGRSLAAGGGDGSVEVWDVRKTTRVARLSGHVGPVRSVAFSPNGRVLASGGEDASVRLWDVAAHRPLTPLTGPTGPVAGLSFSADGSTLAGAGADSSIAFWRLGALGFGGPEPVSAVALGAGESPVQATGGADGAIRLWNLRTGQVIATAEGHRGRVDALALGGGGRMLAAGGTGGVTVWDLASTAGPARLDTDSGPVRAVAFSPDGRLVAGAGGRTLTLWDVRTRAQVATLAPHPSPITTVVFGPDGRTVATGSNDRTVSVAPVPDAAGVSGDCSGGHLGAVRALAFSPRGGLLASVGTDHTLTLWELGPPCRLVRTFTDHTQAVVAVAFSPDGALLASAGEDRVISVREVSGRRTASLTGQAGVTSLVFGATGETLVSADAHGRPIIWDTDPRRVVDGICRTGPRLPGDWHRYVPRGLPAPCP